MRLRSPFLPVAATLAAVTFAAAPKPPAKASPEFRVPLEKTGYRPVSSGILQREGYAMATLDYVDDEHVLLTFNAHKLIPRSPEDQETDQVRLLKAVLLHLPDGRIEREAEWRSHDRNRYLWPLTHGRFLLRLRNELFWVDPMRDQPLIHRHSMLEPHGDIQHLQVSPAGDVVLVETSPERHIGDDPTEPRAEGITASFYQVVGDEHPELKLRARIATDKPFSTTFTSHGFLGTVKEDSAHWGFDFHPFSGKTLELAGFTSTCQPNVEFLSNVTFLAMGCRGGDDRRLLAGFDFAAQANWVFTTDDPPLWPAVTSAPSANRFALRITTSRSGPTNPDQFMPDEIHSQQVRVYSFPGGTELLRAGVSPAQKLGENFDLSPDGERLAVLAGDSLEVYRLPKVTAEEKRETQKQEALYRDLKPMPEGELQLKPPIHPKQ